MTTLGNIAKIKLDKLRKAAFVPMDSSGIMLPPEQGGDPAAGGMPSGMDPSMMDPAAVGMPLPMPASPDPIMALQDSVLQLNSKLDQLIGMVTMLGPAGKGKGSSGPKDSGAGKDGDRLAAIEQMLGITPAAPTTPLPADSAASPPPGVTPGMGPLGAGMPPGMVASASAKSKKFDAIDDLIKSLKL